MTRPIYMSKKDDFSRVPEELMKGFGQPKLAMILPLDGRKNWLMPILKSKTGTNRAGLLFTIPPPPEDLLKQHLSAVKENTSDAKR